VAKLIVALSLIFGATVALAPPAAAAPAWSVSPSPSPPAPAGGTLLGVDCPTPTMCFMVGSYEATTGFDKPLVGRSSGAIWSIVKAPVPQSSDLEAYSRLRSIDCATSTSCFAVGELFDGSVRKALVERWNGTNWSIVTLPAPPGSSYTLLGDISCPTSTACFAVGSSVTGSVVKTLVERWNGTSWTILPSPNVAGATGSALGIVSCASATSCLSVGSFTKASTSQHFAVQWNGTGWSTTAAPIAAAGTPIEFFDVSCASSTLCFAVGSSSTPSLNEQPLIERWNGTSWSVVAAPNPTSDRNRLTGVSCPTATTCFAAGTYVYDGSQNKTLIERWNGTSWSIVSSPNAPKTETNILTAVSCSAATSCVAVGESLTGRTLIEQWNGTTWSIVAKGGSHSGLQNVSCTSASNCFAVGSFNDGSVTKILIERWNGTTWSIVPSPNPAGAVSSGLIGISCVTTTSCFAVGSFASPDLAHSAPLIERWNGSSWVIVASPSPAGAARAGFGSVSCATATSCVAVGSSVNSSFVGKTLIERWNGSTWAIVASPNPAGSPGAGLSSVDCVTATSCFAAGSYTVSSAFNAPLKTLIERWNGTSWSIVVSPNKAGVRANDLQSISCATATSCFAVGDVRPENAPSTTLIQRWNGTSWSIVASPNAVGSNHLAGVSCPTAATCFAVGDVSNGGYRTLVESWNGTTWSLTTSPNVSGADSSQLAGVSCVTAVSCFAVGWSIDVGADSTRISQKALVERYA
jgi:hypothetical protein